MSADDLAPGDARSSAGTVPDHQVRCQIISRHNVDLHWSYASHDSSNIYISYFSKQISWNDCWNLTPWGRVTHICVSKLTIIGSDNGLPPGRRQAIIWTNAGILLMGPLGTNFSEILIEFYTFSFKKMHKKMSGKWQPFCLGLNVLIEIAST